MAATAATAATRTRRKKAASRAFAASTSRLSRPKPRDPGLTRRATATNFRDHNRL
jgi:hypothetical protein